MHFDVSRPLPLKLAIASTAFPRSDRRAWCSGTDQSLTRRQWNQRRASYL